MSTKYHNAKITNPIHRSTAYDFNVQLDFNQLRQQRAGKSSVARFAPSAAAESLDVKEHELVFQVSNGKNAFANRRLHVQSSLNNIQLSADEMKKICAYANVSHDELQRLLRDFCSCNNKDLEHALEDVILSKLRYVGVAITPQANTRAHERQSSQGFAATRGGLNTIINTGEGAIYPGDTVEIGVNFDRLRYGSAPRFHQPSMRDSGVPYDKAVLGVRSSKGAEQFTDATMQLRVLKNMLNKRTAAIQSTGISGNATVAIVDTGSMYHPNDLEENILPAEVTTVLPVKSLPDQGKSVDMSVLTLRTEERLKECLLTPEMLTPANSARDARSGAELQRIFAYEFLNGHNEHQQYCLGNCSVSGSNVVDAPYNRTTVARYRDIEYPGADQFDHAMYRDREATHIGQNMDERIILKVRGRNGNEMRENLSNMLKALNAEWDDLHKKSVEMGEDQHGNYVDLRGDHAIYQRFLQFWNVEQDGTMSVAGYEDYRSLHRRNPMGHVRGAGDPISTGYYYGGVNDASHAPVDVGDDNMEVAGHVQNPWRGNARAYYEEFINRARVPTVYVLWEDHMDIPMETNNLGRAVTEATPVLVPGIWRLVQTSFFTNNENNSTPSDFRLEPVCSDQLFGYTPTMARSFMYGAGGRVGVVGVGTDGARDGNPGEAVDLERAWVPYGPNAPYPNVGEEPNNPARIQTVTSIRELYGLGTGRLGLSNSVFQTPPLFRLGDPDGVLARERFVLMNAGQYNSRPGYARNDGLTFLLAAMSAADSDNALCHTPIAHLVRETIQCTLECMRGEVVKHQQRVIGIALSGAPPGQPFDVCLSSIT